MALTRKLRVGDRFAFPENSRYQGAFTGTVTEVKENNIVWYRDDKTGESSCFIMQFADGQFNQLACHIETL